MKEREAKSIDWNGKNKILTNNFWVSACLFNYHVDWWIWWSGILIFVLAFWAYLFPACSCQGAPGLFQQPKQSELPFRQDEAGKSGWPKRGSGDGTTRLRSEPDPRASGVCHYLHHDPPSWWTFNLLGGFGDELRNACGGMLSHWGPLVLKTATRKAN